MSATKVPEVNDARTGPLHAVRRSGMSQLAIDSLTRFRAADGFSHVRSVAFQITLTALPLFIAFVGFATVVGNGGTREALREAMMSLTPGQTSQTVSQAFKQGSQAGSGSTIALWFGTLAALTSASAAMVYVQRGADRIYGIEDDRSVVERFRRALLIAASSGLLILAAFVLFMAGSSLGKIGGPDVLWKWLRWPATIGALYGGFVLVLRLAPNRKQPPMSWLFAGAAVGTTLWALFTLGLTLYMSLSKGFGKTYGPLAGVIGMLFWAFLSALAIFLAVAFTAQLEASRARRKNPATND